MGFEWIAKAKNDYEEGKQKRETAKRENAEERREAYIDANERLFDKLQERAATEDAEKIQKIREELGKEGLADAMSKKMEGK